MLSGFQTVPAIFCSQSIETCRCKTLSCLSRGYPKIFVSMSKCFLTSRLLRKLLQPPQMTFPNNPIKSSCFATLTGEQIPFFGHATLICHVTCRNLQVSLDVSLHESLFTITVTKLVTILEKSMDLIGFQHTHLARMLRQIC